VLSTILNLGNLVYTQEYPIVINNLDVDNQTGLVKLPHTGDTYKQKAWALANPKTAGEVAKQRKLEEAAREDASAYEPKNNKNKLLGPRNKKYAFPMNITNYDYIRYECKPYQDIEIENTRIDEQAVLYLPMPAELNEQLEAGWGAQDDWLKRNVKYLSGTMAKALREEFTKGVGKNGIVEGIVGAVTGAFGGGGVGQRTVERRRGRIVNPVSEQFFTGMSHRTWEFVHKLVAESHEEAIRLDRIINIFKSASSAKLDGHQNYFLNYPLHWDIKFMMGFGGQSEGANQQTDKSNPYLPKLNSCAITQIATNFSGAGAWASHVDGSPVEIDLTLSLTELVIPTAANFGGQADRKNLGELATVGWESKQLKADF
jgi:hypothetical protein